MAFVWIFFIIFILIIVIIGVWYYFFRISDIDQAGVRYGQMIQLNNPFFNNGLLSFCNESDNSCTKKLFIPNVTENNIGINSRTWKIVSSTIPDGTIVKYGDTIKIVSASMGNQPVGFCDILSGFTNCTDNIGLLPNNTTSNSTSWIIKSDVIPDNTNVLANQTLKFLSSSKNLPMAGCGTGSASCGGSISVPVTLRSDTGIADTWVILNIPEQ